LFCMGEIKRTRTSECHVSSSVSYEMCTMQYLIILYSVKLEEGFTVTELRRGYIIGFFTERINVLF